MFDVRDPDYQARVARIFSAAPFMTQLGAEMLACGPGWCESRLDLRPEHMQQDDVVHAGVQASLADHTAGAAAGTLVGAEQIVLTATFNVHLLRAAQGERLSCRAEVLKAGKRLIVSKAVVHCESGQSTIQTAELTATLAVV